jgi:hypothetical protein
LLRQPGKLGKFYRITTSSDEVPLPSIIFKFVNGTFGTHYTRSGNREKALKCLERLENLLKKNNVTCKLAAINANSGNFNEAFVNLNKLDAARFQKLPRKIGLNNQNL